MKALHMANPRPTKDNTVWQKNPDLFTENLTDPEDIEDREFLRGKFLGKWITFNQSREGREQAGSSNLSFLGSHATDGDYKFYIMPDDGQYQSNEGGIAGGQGGLKFAEYIVKWGGGHFPKSSDDLEGSPADARVAKLEGGFVLAEYDQKTDTWTRSECKPCKDAITDPTPMFFALAYFLIDAALNVFGCFITFYALKWSCIDTPSHQLKLMLVYTASYLIFTSVCICTHVTNVYARVMGLESGSAHEEKERHAGDLMPKEKWADEDSCTHYFDSHLP
jgi:hypothetical protein